MGRSIPKLVVGFVILAVLALAAIILFSRPASTPPPLPNPNGYDDLVKAGQMLTNHFEDYETLSQAELRAALTNNAEALQLARRGLSRPCRVPLEDSPTSTTVMGNRATFKRIGRTFAAEGRLAELENRPSDAAASYVDLLRLGHHLARGGVIIDALIGTAAEGMGLTPLEKLFPKLEAKPCRELASTLEALESRRQSAATMLEQEHAWTRRTYGLKGQMIRLVKFKNLRQMEQTLTGKIQAQELRTRRLIIDLAARAYELEKGERPKNLADLVPAYLKAIPQDPLTGTNMVYRP